MERAQFSPQAETELSGLCDDAMGGASPVETAPWREPVPRGRRPAAHIPGRLITAPTVFTVGTRKPGRADTQVRPYGVYQGRIFSKFV